MLFPTILLASLTIVLHFSDDRVLRAAATMLMELGRSLLFTGYQIESYGTKRI
jgi:hypothetical protein